ncbi:melanocyte-stimulating hormone receptor-like [Actinia tenebrosa]|uniref:Melanocyte-stimulating hormone receptor-like n=1 Tax=Actinia tenebrosa TaxID=6105 RepID=A0A6P8GYF4_ACTTE|nr:melanocyte-stimulating hormone receptor-like [Actinia tenebrosa]
MKNVSVIYNISTKCSVLGTAADLLEESRSYGLSTFLSFIISINFVAALFAIVCNSAVIYILSRTPSLVTPSNILILGLAISDFMVGILSQPFFCLVHYSYLARKSSLLCTGAKIYDSSVNALGTASFLTLVAITAERYLAVRLHLRYLELVTVKRCGIVIFCIWNFIFITLLLLVAFFLFNISRTIRRHSRQIQAQQHSIQQSMNQSINIPKYKKSVNTMYFVIGAFALCYAPYALGLIIFDVAQVNTSPYFKRFHLFTVTETFVMCNGLFNPIIYCWKIKEIRNALLQVIRRI